EFAADLIGMRLCVAAETEDAVLGAISSPDQMRGAERRRLAPCIAVGGIETVLILMDVAERYSMHFHGPRAVDSHPSAYMRLANIRTAARFWGRKEGDPLAESAQHLAELGGAFESMSGTILNLILHGRF